MIFIEFQPNLNYRSNLIKYRDIHASNWYYLYLDIETLNLLVTNYGVITTFKFPTSFTSKIIELNYCGADIQLFCGNNAVFYLP